MQRFWTTHIDPLLRAARPRRVLAIGAGDDDATRGLIAFCRETGCAADIADPSPAPALAALAGSAAGAVAVHAKTGLDAIAVLPPLDLVLRNGDRNWWTTYQELTGLFDRAAAARTPPPIVIFADAAWPYARRDMYDDPARVHIDNRQPYAYRGIAPGKAELVEGGLNAHLANAVSEGGARNGVLTAVENFIAEWPEAIQLHVLPVFNGLGIAVPDVRMTPEIRQTIDSFLTTEALLALCTSVETERLLLEAELQQERVRMAKRTEALQRARQLLSERGKN